MSRKDFELIAATIRRRVEDERKQDGSPTYSPSAVAVLQGLAADFARELSATNPRFDAGRFLEACGL